MNHPIRYHTAKMRRHAAPAQTIVRTGRPQPRSTESILRELETADHPFLTPHHHWLACQASKLEYRRR